MKAIMTRYHHVWISVKRTHMEDTSTADKNMYVYATKTKSDGSMNTSELKLNQSHANVYPMDETDSAEKILMPPSQMIP